MGTDYNHEIGYESLLADFKRYQSQTPKGISLQNKRNSTIVLKFKINGNDKSKGCNCSFTLDGMATALIKARLVADRLKTTTSIVEFETWYDNVILEKNQIVDDRISFSKAIAIVENDFWNRHDRRNRKRDKTNASDISSYYETYGRFYKHLPDRAVNLDDINAVLSRWDVGTRSYKYALSAFKKLARMIKRNDILNELENIQTTQTSFMKLQSVTLDDFLDWRTKTLTDLPSNAQIAVRRAWLWIFSMQVVYGLRIHEVFAIANIDKPFTTDDGVTIPALSDNANIIVINNRTSLGTTTKTGYRLARPLIPPKYPNLIELLDIQRPLLPANKPVSANANTIRKFYTKEARKKLVKWNAPITQTHALRHLANINGIQAGIPIEVRAMSLGHSTTMNETVYKKRCATQTMIDLLS
jgi:integrase